MAVQNYARLFTVDEANALVPALRALMEHISDKLDSLRKKSKEIIRAEGLSPKSPDLTRRLQENPEIAGLTREVHELVEEIHSQGCLWKGLEQGLVDFPCLLGGEIVFLCWRYGEEGVGHWHRIEDGFAGRKPLLEQDGGGGNRVYH